MRLFITLLISTLLTISAFAAVRGEASVSQPVYGAAPAEPSSGIVATDGTTFLAAWIDDREGRTTIYAGRLSSTGELLDPTGIRIATNPDAVNKTLANVLATVDGYVVLWNQQIFTGGGSGAPSQISAARIDRDGHVDGPRVILEGAIHPTPGSRACRLRMREPFRMRGRVAGATIAEP